MAVLRKGGADGLKIALKIVRDAYGGTLPIDVVNDVIDRFFEGYSAPSPLTFPPGKRCPDPNPGKRWPDTFDSPPKFTWEIPVTCADSRENLSPSTVQIGDSAHIAIAASDQNTASLDVEQPSAAAAIAQPTHAGEVEVSQSYSAEPAPVSSNDTVVGEPAPNNHDTSGGGPCSPSASAAFFGGAPPELVWTTEKPTEPGSYWVETSSGAQYIREVNLVNGKLVAVDPGLSYEVPLDFYERFAPIPKPVEKGGAA